MPNASDDFRLEWHGNVVIISAFNAKGGAGHISVVIAEDATHKAQPETVKDKATGKETPTGAMAAPLQSQAGSVNIKYGGITGAWWKGAEMRREVLQCSSPGR